MLPIFFCGFSLLCKKLFSVQNGIIYMNTTGQYKGGAKLTCIKRESLLVLRKCFEALPEHSGSYVPTVEQIKSEIEPKFEDYLPLILWIIFTGDEGDSPEQIRSRNYLLKLAEKNIKIFERKAKTKGK